MASPYVSVTTLFPSISAMSIVTLKEFILKDEERLSSRLSGCAAAILSMKEASSSEFPKVKVLSFPSASSNFGYCYTNTTNYKQLRIEINSSSFLQKKLSPYYRILNCSSEEIAMQYLKNCEL